MGMIKKEPEPVQEQEQEQPATQPELTVPQTEQEKIEDILIDRKEVGYWRGRI